MNDSPEGWAFWDGCVVPIILAILVMCVIYACCRGGMIMIGVDW